MTVPNILVLVVTFMENIKPAFINWPRFFVVLSIVVAANSIIVAAPTTRMQAKVKAGNQCY